MKAKPILFSTDMVNAINNNLKCQTRRTQGLEKLNKHPDWYRYDSDSNYEDKLKHLHYFELLDLQGDPKEQYTNVACKIKPGDILWVRESWALSGFCFDEGFASITYKDGSVKTYYPSFNGIENWFIRKVDKLQDKGYIEADPDDEERFNIKKLKWEPSIFMPKWACRLLLKVTNVRAERLHDITEDDAILEGTSHYGNYNLATESFRAVWESINGKGSWNLNPWVWVYEFEKCKKPENLDLNRL